MGHLLARSSATVSELQVVFEPGTRASTGALVGSGGVDVVLQLVRDTGGLLETKELGHII